MLSLSHCFIKELSCAPSPFLMAEIRRYYLVCNLASGQLLVLSGLLIRITGYASKNSSVLEAESICAV